MDQKIAAACTWNRQQFCMEFMGPYIVFPNGDVAEVQSWRISTDAQSPSTPQGLRPYSKVADLRSLEQVAREIGGVLAHPRTCPIDFIVETLSIVFYSPIHAMEGVERIFKNELGHRKPPRLISSGDHDNCSWLLVVRSNRWIYSVRASIFGDVEVLGRL